jgi:hypothetical protein
MMNNEIKNDMLRKLEDEQKDKKAQIILLERSLKEIDAKIFEIEGWVIRIGPGPLYHTLPHFYISKRTGEMIYMQISNCNKDIILKCIYEITSQCPSFNEYIYKMEERYGRDDDVRVVFKNDKYTMIHNFGSEGGGHTNHHDITKENLLEILKFMSDHVQ